MDKFNDKFNEMLKKNVAHEIMQLEQEIAEKTELLESMKLSAGMVRGFGRTANIKSECGGCGFGIPKYRGRYPNYCPACGERLEAGVKHDYPEVPNDVPLDESKMDLKGFSQLIIDKGGKGISTADAKKHNVPFEVFLQMPSKPETLVKNAKKVIDHFNKKGK